MPNASDVLILLTGNHFTGSEDERLRKIPLLSEVFKAFPNLPINIDVKQGGGDLIKEINKLVVIHQREEDTVWGSFMEEVGSKCYQQVTATRIC